MKRRWTQVIAWIVCAAVLYFVGKALIQQINQVQWSKVHLRLLPALAAVACIFGVSLVQLAARWTLLIAYGYHLPWRVQLLAAWVPQLGKYVPGGVASVGGAVLILRKHGVPAAVGLSVAVLLDALAVLAGLIVSAPLLMSPAVRERSPHAWIPGVAMIVIGLVMIHPKVFGSMLNWSLKKAKRQPIEQLPPISRFLWPVVASFAQWIVAGLGLWFTTLTVTSVSAAQLPLFVASAAFAMTISYIVPLAPGGLGIREGIYMVTLKSVIGPEVAIVALAMRVVQTVIEIVLAAIGLIVVRQTADELSPTVWTPQK